MIVVMFVVVVMRVPMRDIGRHVLVNRPTHAQSFQKLLDPDLLKGPVV